MIKAVAIKEKDRLSLQIVGHAQYNPGNDVVCAGVSALFQSLLRYILSYEQNQLIHGETLSGNSKLIVKSTPTIEAVYNASVDSIRDISATYGDEYVSLTDLRDGM